MFLRPSPFTRYVHPALFRLPSSRLTRQPLSACCSSSCFFVVRTDQQVLQQVLDDAIRQAEQGPLNGSQYASLLTAVTKASSVDSRFSLPNPKHQLFLRHQVTCLDANRFASFAPSEGSSLSGQIAPEPQPRLEYSANGPTRAPPCASGPICH